MDPAPGVSIRPNVRLVAPIGRGGMGSVWSAEHADLDAQVAVKFVAPERLAKDPKLAERLRREAAVAAKLESPHALRVHDYGETDDGTPFLVMERLSGETLAARLAREGRLTPADVVAIVTQVAGALEAAHALGVVHRDVKPDNLFLLDADGAVFVKVLDFGVAKDLALDEGDSLTTTGAVLGTPSYMAPEQLLGAVGIDARADVWSLGVVAYHTMVGRRPFEAPTGPALALAICSGAFTPPSERVAGLGPALDAWFGRSLAVDRERRFATVGEQALAFAAAVASTAAEIEPNLERPPASSADVVTEDARPALRPAAGRGERTAASPPAGIESTGAEARGPDTGRGRARRTWIAIATGVLALACVLALLARERGAAGVSGAASDAAAPSATPASDVASSLGAPSPPSSSPPSAATSPPASAPPSPEAPAASAEPEASAAPAPANTPASARLAASAPPRAPTSTPAPAKPARPAWCDTDEGLVFDARGRLTARPECR